MHVMCFRAVSDLRTVKKEHFGIHHPQPQFEVYMSDLVA
jgi:hypothetical protein